MSCHELVDLITAYLEGTLPRPERAGLEAHLEQCSHCRTYLEQMRQTIATLGTLREQGVSTETRAGLLDAFRRWRGAADCRGR